MTAGLFIYGSCVSRDTAEFLGDDFHIVKYSARQSVISAGTHVDVNSLGYPPADDSFNYRALVQDAEGNALSSLRHYANTTNVVLWDLVDERLGVFDMGDGKYVTRSIEMPLDEDPDFAPRGAKRFINFGTDEHFDLWVKGVKRFTTILEQSHLVEHTRLVYVPWAAETITGEEVPSSYGISAFEANVEYLPYVEYVNDHTAIDIITVDPEIVVADPGHKWGLAPFHYAQPVYDSLVEQITAIPPKDTTASQ